MLQLLHQPDEQSNRSALTQAQSQQFYKDAITKWPWHSKEWFVSEESHLGWAARGLLMTFSTSFSKGD